MTKTDKTFAETGRWLVYLPLGYLAIRPGEIRDPRIRNIDLKKGVVVFSVDQSKNRRNPVVTIPAQIIPHLAALHLDQYPGNNYIFGRAKGWLLAKSV